MNHSSKSSPGSKGPEDKHSYTGWSTLIGVGLGIVIGLVTRHWLALAFGLGALGYAIGAFIDRSRR